MTQEAQDALDRATSGRVEDGAGFLGALALGVGLAGIRRLFENWPDRTNVGKAARILTLPLSVALYSIACTLGIVLLLPYALKIGIVRTGRQLSKLWKEVAYSHE